MTILVSVILPFYNSKRMLRTALESLRNQRLETMEIVAIDDGSSDASAALLEAAARQGLSVNLLKNYRNIGIVASLNRGLDEARGRFIARMDADDISMPHRISHQVAFLEKTGIDLCGSWFVEFGQGISRTVRWPYTEAALRAAILFQNTICHPTVMARREVFEQFRYRETYRLAEDYDLFARASAKFRLANIPEPLLRYRRHPQQATQAKRNDMEKITRQIRLEALQAQGFNATPEEQRLHNLIRAPYSISSVDDLKGIEAWLLKLHAAHDDKGGKRIVASQWIRACIRAAPLGHMMWKTFRSSPLHDAAGAGLMTRTDLRVLATLKLGYDSKPFAALRRYGLSA
ncbi:MAG: glycosyltransferase [Nitrococcus mobilis]|nr:glycosyltransferase [Nitrococcus mobilis]